MELDFANRQSVIVNPTGAKVYVRPNGVTDDQIDTLTRKNPQRFLAGK
jgi:predicted metal-dependent phosphotriesterase family hydrolase